MTSPRSQRVSAQVCWFAIVLKHWRNWFSLAKLGLGVRSDQSGIGLLGPKWPNLFWLTGDQRRYLHKTNSRCRCVPGRM